MLILKRPWTRQPQSIARLRDLWEGHAVSPISGAFPTFTADSRSAVVTVGTVTQTTIAAGLAQSQAAGTNLRRALIPGSTIGTGAGNNGAAFLVQFRTTTTSSSAYIGGFGSDSGSSGNTLFAFMTGANDASQLRVAVGNIIGTAAREIVAGKQINDGAVHTALVSLNNFNTSGNCIYQLYLDGNFLVEQTDPVSLGATNVFNWVCAGAIRRTTDLNVGAAAQISLAVGFNRRVAHEQAIALTQNPWLELFAPQQIIIPTATAAGYTHPTLSLATATEIGTTSFKPSVTYTFA